MPTSSRAASCGRSGRRKAPPAPPDETLDQDRRRPDVKKSVERVDHVVLAQVHDRQQHGRGPEDESARERAIAAPRVHGSQRGGRGVKRGKGGELIWVRVRGEGGHGAVRAPEFV